MHREQYLKIPYSPLYAQDDKTIRVFLESCLMFKCIWAEVLSMEHVELINAAPSPHTALYYCSRAPFFFSGRLSMKFRRLAPSSVHLCKIVAYLHFSYNLGKWNCAYAYSSCTKTRHRHRSCFMKKCWNAIKFTLQYCAPMSRSIPVNFVTLQTPIFLV